MWKERKDDADCAKACTRLVVVGRGRLGGILCLRHASGIG